MEPSLSSPIPTALGPTASRCRVGQAQKHSRQGQEAQGEKAEEERKGEERGSSLTPWAGVSLNLFWAGRPPSGLEVLWCAGPAPPVRPSPCPGLACPLPGSRARRQGEAAHAVPITVYCFLNSGRTAGRPVQLEISAPRRGEGAGSREGGSAGARAGAGPPGGDGQRGGGRGRPEQQLEAGAGSPSPHQVEGEPVHEQGLRRRHGHGQVHAQLVPGAAHRDPLGRCLRQDLQPQRPDLGREGVHPESSARAGRPGVLPSPASLPPRGWLGSSFCSWGAWVPPKPPNRWRGLPPTQAL